MTTIVSECLAFNEWCRLNRLSDDTPLKGNVMSIVIKEYPCIFDCDSEEPCKRLREEKVRIFYKNFYGVVKYEERYPT